MITLTEEKRKEKIEFHRYWANIHKKLRDEAEVSDKKNSKLHEELRITYEVAAQALEKQAALIEHIHIMRSALGRTGPTMESADVEECHAALHLSLTSAELLAQQNAYQAKIFHWILENIVSITSQEKNNFSDTMYEVVFRNGKKINATNLREAFVLGYYAEKDKED
jgi:hypothetical protein